MTNCEMCGILLTSTGHMCLEGKVIPPETPHPRIARAALVAQLATTLIRGVVNIHDSEAVLARSCEAAVLTARQILAAAEKAEGI